jgi:hypothetical protein
MAASDPRSSLWLVVTLLTALVSGAEAQGAPQECRDAQQCRELALEARARGAHETFHDLAWRAVQTGRPNDPDLMYLLARAQALSGRRRDAVVMLRRLAESGYAIDAMDEDFRRVRELGEWQYVASLLNRTRTAASAPAPAPAPVPAPAAVEAVLPSKPIRSAARAAVPRLTRPSNPPSALAAAATAAAVPPTKPPSVPPAATPAKPAAAPPLLAVARRTLPLKPAVVEDAARFSTGPFTPAGIAYDAISRRFLFGDVTGRRLFVVGEGSERSVDLVRADSAGFDDVTALAIDAKRGDLWVASTATDGSAGTVHRLQLISGRSLTKFAVPVQGPMRLSDLAVAGDGTLFILDSGAPRLLALRPGASAVEPLMRLEISNAASVAVDDLGQRAYVAHSEGITRVDLQARRASPLTAVNGIALTDFDYIRAYRDSLVGSQVQTDGSRGIVRLQLNGDRRAVSAATLIDTSSAVDAGMATISGDDLYYLTGIGQASTAGPADVRVKRLKLR